MQRSTDRIYTTHVGSLARPSALLDLMRAAAAGEPVDETERAEAERQAVADVVARQRSAGLDVISDGEQTKTGHDAPLAEYVDTLFTIRAGAFSFEAANPRHEHVYHVFESVKPPRDAVLLPGVISHAANIVEHPDTIADRIVRFAELVGRENVVASADCGFSSQATYRPEIHPQIVWAKFESLAEGARRASARLWN
ncbi:MAG TPA: hypothetical protein VFX25_02675 [Streptosporangiaceae bacterium]|nr:hypothetical protein [Streptosporangiaceae bacterium]